MNDKPKDNAQVLVLGDRWLHIVIEGGEEVNLGTCNLPDKPLKPAEQQEQGGKGDPSNPPV